MMRRALLAVIAATSVAHAQPTDPYGPAPAPAPAPNPSPDPNATPAPALPDPNSPEVLDEQIAESLVERAQELFDARVFVDAKQLAVEALVKSPNGAAGAHAKFLIAAINKQLGITDSGSPGEKKQPDLKVDTSPITDPTVAPPKPPVLPPQPEGGDEYRLPARVHGGLYLGLVGTTIGAFFSKSTPAGGAIPMGLAFGAAGGYLVPKLTDRLHWNDAQVMTAGAGSVWAGIAGGLIADAAKTEGTTARQVLVGSTIGSTVGLAAGAGLATQDNYTEGDIALVDTLAGIGGIGGLTVGMLMQPAEGEAYSVNALLGIAGGVVVGLIAAPQTNTTPRRMLRVAGFSAAGGALPFLLYAGIHKASSHADERLTGFLSTAGLIAGAYVGFRLTRDLDVDQDVKPGAKKKSDDDEDDKKPDLDKKPDDAPPVEVTPAALIQRHASGRIGVGMIGVQPLSLDLAPQPGLALPLVAGSW